jgi:transcriptional regulator with XRE-family HTH domain
VKDEELRKLAETGRRIRKAREASGLNLHELALLSGVSGPALSLIENGKRDLRLTSLFRIAAALRVGAGDLFEERSAEARVPSGEGYDLKDYT